MVPQVPLCFEPNVKSLAPQSCHWQQAEAEQSWDQELVRVFERLA